MERNFSQITFDFTPPENPVQTSKLQPPKPENLTEDVAEATTVSEEPVITFTPVQKSTGRGRKSQKLYAAEADLVNIPEDEILFQKQYYTIGEVSQMFQVNFLLRRRS